ncbi:MAG TPA: hypothetical protein VI818_02530 [Candidatus Thermoplasmatota archaeon]|nr:hypothetical protein [Candidatus Thermoplasmatota archaeon]
MKLRIVSYVSLMALLAVAIVPSMSVAQNQAHVSAWMDWEVEHEHHLKETGRDIMKAKITVRAQNFTCVNQDTSKTNWKIRGDLVQFDPPFPKVYGASMKPTFFSIAFNNNEPGVTTSVPKTDETVVLDIAWNVEDRPKKDAKFTYVVKISNLKLDAGWGNPQCAPQSIVFQEGRSKGMTVYMDDIVENVNGTCDVTTDPDKCLGGATTAAPPPAEAPILDTTILMGGIVALAVVLRRRRQA